MSVERNYNLALVAALSAEEKQIQQSYRPIIGVHKWFARRPGALFRGLILSEFAEAPLEQTYFEGNKVSGTILDPFMGGGTPLFEAVRVGLNVVGCDVNPIARWIVEREIEPLDLDDFRASAELVADRVGKLIGDFYCTTCSCGAEVPVKYFLWVKTQACEACGMMNQLFPGFLVAGHGRHSRDVFVCPKCMTLSEFDPSHDARSCQQCHTEIPQEGTARRNRFTCTACAWENRYPSVDPDGPPKHELFALEYYCASCKREFGGRRYKTPDAADMARRDAAVCEAEELDSPYWPHDPIPAGDETRRLHRWGYHYYRDLFGPRQLLGLHHLAAAIDEFEEGPVRHAMATVFSDMLRYQNMVCRYDLHALKCQDIFSVHGYPVGLVQCENNVVGTSRIGGGGWVHFIEKYVRAKEYGEAPFETVWRGKRKVRRVTPGERIAATFVSRTGLSGSRKALLHLGSVETLKLPAASVDAVLTDPPYFDNVQYAELIDFCYVWLRRLQASRLFSSETTRDSRELTGNHTEARTLATFTAGLASVFSEAAHALKPGGLFAFTYHHNNLGAYASVAVALLDAGLIPTEALVCPSEMRASLHIHGTESSTMDTIFVCRKPPWSDPGDFATVAFGLDQLESLRGVGLKPGIGDRRCLALGIATVRAIRALAAGWPLSALLDHKLARAKAAVEEEFEAIGQAFSMPAAKALKGHEQTSLKLDSVG